MSAIEPIEIVRGTTVTWRRATPGYTDADGWALTYELDGPTHLQVAAVPDGDGFAVSLAIADTNGLTAGSRYLWGAYATKGADRELLASGSILVLEDVAQAGSPGDQQTHAEKMLALLEAVLENRATVDQASYAIAGRSIARIPIMELKRLKNSYQADVERERRTRASGGVPGRRRPARFGFGR